MITIVNYRMGNIRSVQSALEYLGAPCQISGDPRTIEHSDMLILPGVGSFRVAMKNLNMLGMTDALREAVLIRKRPILGICLGMQLLADEGTEDGITRGLGWIPGKVVRFAFDDTAVKIPHIGFNSVHVDTRDPLFAAMSDEIDLYNESHQDGYLSQRRPVDHAIRKIADRNRFVTYVLHPRQLAHRIANGTARENCLNDLRGILEPRSVADSAPARIVDDRAVLYVEVSPKDLAEEQASLDADANVRMGLLQSVLRALDGSFDDPLFHRLLLDVVLRLDAHDLYESKSLSEDVPDGVHLDLVRGAHRDLQWAKQSPVLVYLSLDYPGRAYQAGVVRLDLLMAVHRTGSRCASCHVPHRWTAR